MGTSIIISIPVNNYIIIFMVVFYQLVLHCNLIFFGNCHLKLFKLNESFELCLKFMNVMYYVLFKFMIKICC